MRLKNKLLIFLACFLIMSVSITALEDITREEAVEAIDDVKETIKELELLNYSVNFYYDYLDEATHALERADLAILITQNQTDEVAEVARELLKGFDYKEFTYSGVLIHTNKIEDRKIRMYNILDDMLLLELKYEEYTEEKIVFSNIEGILEEIQYDFDNELYPEAEKLLTNTNKLLDEAKASQSHVKLVLDSSKNFFLKNWWEILLVIFILTVGGNFAFKHYYKEYLSSQIKNLKMERKALQNLQKKIQIDSFQKGTLSKSQYDIRKNTYDERLTEIEEQLPVIEDTFKKYKKTK